MSRVLPILFNTDMVRAILGGRKTVTRRLMKPQLPDECPKCMYIHNEYIYDTNAQEVYCASCGEPLYKSGTSYKAPYQPGDILYARETIWQKTGHYLDVDGETKAVFLNEFRYAATDEKPEVGWNYSWVKRPSIHMPKEAARIWLKVTDVRVERLQDMPHDAALKEGIHFCKCPDGFTWKSETDIHNCYTTPMGAMRALWDSTIKKSDLDRYGWDGNPWVWVIEFERCEKPEGEL